jgi:hypothetical protein
VLIGSGDVDREWLLDELEAALGRLGFERFVAGPILDPSPSYFPDSYPTVEERVRRTARRLAHWVAHDTTPSVDLEGAEDDERWLLRGRASPRGLTIEVQRIGPARDLIGELVPVVTDAICYAERLQRGSGAPYRGSVEPAEASLASKRTAVAAVALGFGLLALERAARHGPADAVDELAYLLAAQIEIRGREDEGAAMSERVSERARTALSSQLQELEGQRSELVARLSLPAPGGWPPVEIPDQPEPFTSPGRLAVRRQTLRERNARKPVFRVPEHSGGLGLMLGGVAAVFSSFALGLPSALLITLTVTGSVFGYFLGRGARRDYCSAPNCGARIRLGDERCPKCGGVVAGVIAHAGMRLEAEERLPASFYSDHDLDPP